MADKTKAKLTPVIQNGSYCRFENGKLIVVVTNEGDEKAPVTATRLDFRVYGSQDRETGELKKGETVKLEFNAPSESCFNPDCKFDIIVDVTNVLREDPITRTNVTRVVCTKLPHLVLVPNSVKKAGRKVIAKVRNQGGAYARSSTAKILIDGYGEIEAKTPELEPGAEEDVAFELPKTVKVIKGLEYTILLDVKKVVHVADETGKYVPKPYTGELS